MRVGKSEMELRGLTSLAEALRTLEGVSVRDYGGIGGLKTVSIRSFGAQHTGVSYDGLPITDCQNGQVDIGRFSLDAISSIKVDIGGSDDIFRAARLANYAGTVSLSGVDSGGAKSDEKGLHGDVQMRYGSFATYNPYVRVRNIKEEWTYGAWANYVNSNGEYPFKLRNGQFVTNEVRLNSQVEQLNGEVYARGNLGRRGRLLLKGSAYDSSRGLPGTVIYYTQFPTEHLWDRTLSFSAQHEQSRGQWRLRTSLSYSNIYNRYTDTAPAKPVPDDDRYTQQQAGFSAVAMWEGTLPSWKATDRRLAVSLAEDVDVVHLASNLPQAALPTRENSHTALSARFASERLNAVATLLGLVSAEQTKSGEPAPLRWRLCPTVSASWRILPEKVWRLRASYKETYRLPTFNDLYYQRVGNRNLRPERARQCNVGTTWQKLMGRHTVGLTADGYFGSVRDKIVAVPTMFVWSMRNVGRVNMAGLDASVHYGAKCTKWLALNVAANYSLQYAVDVTDPEAKNYRHQIAYTPRHSGNAVVTLATPWLNVSYTLSAVGERYSLSQNTPAYRIAPYADHSLSLNHTFLLPPFARGRCSGLRLHVSGEALNLAGRNYEVIKYYPMPGRHYRASLRLEF